MRTRQILTDCILGLFILLGTNIAWSQVTPQESLKSLKPADGFEVSLWASEPMVNNPTGMDIDSRGRVWVAEGLNYRLWAKRKDQFKRVPGADRIKILHDTNGDGKADKVTIFAENIFPPPLGLAVREIWKEGKLCGTRVYVGLSPNLLVLEDTDGDDIADRRYSLLTGFGGIDSDHGLHGMALGPDGKLYFTQGDARYGTDRLNGGDTTFDVTDKSGRRLKSNRYGTTLRVNLDGTDFEVIGYRQRNNYETCINSFAHVFTSDNDDDGLRGCRMIWMMDGGDYGYKTARSNRHSAEELPGIVPKLVGTGNGSPAGILVYEADLFPKEFHGAVIQLDAGTHQVNYHPLVRHGAGFRTEYRVLLSGEDSWFRPVDATVAPNGSLFICDWYDAGVGGNRFSDQDTGRIYQLKPVGSKLRADSTDFTSLKGLIAALKSPNIVTRFAARESLLEKGKKSRNLLMSLFQKGRSHESARALFLLAELPQTGKADLLAALKNDNAQIRELALRLLARDLARESVVEPDSAKRVEPRAVQVMSDILPLVDDTDAGVRRELILALRNVETPKAGNALKKLAASWDGRDRYYAEALHLALKHREGEFLQELFTLLTENALSDCRKNQSVALPPYYPITTNDAFLHIDDELPPANGASKLIGLAWELGRKEALPALRAILEKIPAPDIVRGTDMALNEIDDPQAAGLLIDRFLAIDDSQRQREILGLLGPRLAGVWEPMRNTEKTQKMFNIALARDDLQVAAIKSIARSRSSGYGEELLKLVSNNQQELSTRATALEALGKLRYEPVRAMAGQLLEQAKGKSQGGPLALAALSTISDFQGDEARKLLEEVLSDKQYPLDFRRHAIQLLAATPQGARRLLVLHDKKQIDEALKSEVTFLLLNHADRQIRKIAHEKISLPEKANGKKIIDLNEVLALQGDSKKGRDLFHQKGNNSCASCHRVQGIGDWIGPDLSSIGTKYGKREMLYHILNPNGAINYNYVSYTLLLEDGRVLTGLITEETANRVVLKTAQGQRIEIPAEEIELKKAQSISIMPENLVDTMTQQDIADLTEYMATLRQPVSTVGQYYLLGPLSDGTYDASSQIDLQKSWSGPNGGKVRWQLVPASGDNYLDLTSLLGSKPGNELFCYVPYASPREQTARLVFNTNNDINLWHNGQPVKLALAVGDGHKKLWQGTIKMRAGSNHLTIKIASGKVNSGLITTIITDRAIRFDFDKAQGQ